MPTWLGPLGYLPLAVPVVALVPPRLGARLAPQAGTVERLLVGAVATVAIVTFALRIAAQLGVLSPYALLALLVALWLAGRPSTTRIARDPLVTPVAIVAAVALGIVLAAAYFMPVWQWDSLGYHLPFVGFVLQDGNIAGLPADVPYLSTYPHNIELVYLALRMLLPDDRLIDLGQVPFGLLGALATAGIARKLGSKAPVAIVAGLLWLTMPAVLLQLPTNYVDVGAAAYLLCAIYFLVGEGTRRNQLFAGLALGLFLGAKPSAPPATVLCGLVLLWRARRDDRAITALACVIVVVLGAEAYLTNLVRHHNPTWPVRIDIGPLHLPGVSSVNDLLTSGQGAPHLTGHFRMFRSWLTLVPPPIFDMRIGGFGPPFVLALAPALLVLWQRRRSALPVLALAALVAPDPAIARYTLAFPGVVLALSALWFGERVSSARAGLVLGAIAAFNVAVAWPGFPGEGPPLGSYLQLSWADREGAVGPDRQTAHIDAVRDELVAGDTAACDGSFEFPYLLWRPDLANRVRRITTPADRESVLRDDTVRLLVVDDRLSLDPARWRRRFHCETDSCVVYSRR
ncbi:MAG: hypothetical protein ABI321_08025 [Polyangia bacterium]